MKYEEFPMMSKMPDVAIRDFIRRCCVRTIHRSLINCYMGFSGLVLAKATKMGHVCPDLRTLMRFFQEKKAVYNYLVHSQLARDHLARDHFVEVWEITIKYRVGLKMYLETYEVSPQRPASQVEGWQVIHTASVGPI